MFIFFTALLFVALGFLLAGFGLYMALRPKKSWQQPPRPPKFFGLDGKPRSLTPEELKQRKTAHVTRRTAHNSSHIHHTDEQIATASAITYSTLSTDNGWSGSSETSWSSGDSNSSGDWSNSSSSDISYSSSSDSCSSSSDSGSSSSSDFGGGGSGGNW